MAMRNSQRKSTNPRSKNKSQYGMTAAEEKKVNQSRGNGKNGPKPPRPARKSDRNQKKLRAQAEAALAASYVRKPPPSGSASGLTYGGSTNQPPSTSKGGKSGVNKGKPSSKRGTSRMGRSGMMSK
jgi:hypothetical protein